MILMFVRNCLFALAMFGLAACDQVTDGIASLGAPEDVTNQGIRTLSLLDGSVRARGPEGYCIDQTASNARRGFAVMAGCALLSDEAVVMPSLDGLISVQFGDEGTASVSGNEDVFRTFLGTQAGQAILAQNGESASVSDVYVTTDQTGVIVRYTDASGPSFPETSNTQSRGFLDVNGRLVTVTVRAFKRNELSRSAAERLLVLAMQEVAAANRVAQPTDENI